MPVFAPDAVPSGPSAPPTPLDPAAFSSAHNTLLSDSSIQFDLPMRPPDPPPPPPEPPSAFEQWLADFFSADHPVLRLSLWVLAGLFALAIVALIVMRLRGMEWPWARRGAGAGEEDADWRPEEAEARELLGEADALAAAGRYSEAAHLLLYRSIEDVDERRPDLVRKSLTSREVAALLRTGDGVRGPAPAKAGGAFTRIAALVERGFFARRDLGPAEWRECRTAYEEFAFAEGWRG